MNTTKQTKTAWWKPTLLALICFGPPLAFFTWTGWQYGIRQGDYTILLVPLTGLVGATTIWAIARRLPPRQ